MSLNTSVAGAGVLAGDDIQSYVDAQPHRRLLLRLPVCAGQAPGDRERPELVRLHDTFVPTQSFDYLYEVASDLASKAVDAERQVFQMEQLFEQAEEKEFLAGQALELAEEQLARR